MGDSGGTAEITLTCGRDGTPTRLRCAECQDPICPSCYVRTPVGLRCPNCAVASGPPARDYEAPAGSRPRWVVPAVVAAVLAVAVAGALAIGRGSDSAVSDDLPEGRATTERVRIGTGPLPRGGWVLDARRGQGICATLSLVPGGPGPERCHRLPANGHLADPTTSRVTTPTDTIYLTVGVVSERTARVLVAPEGQTPWEVPALGAEAALGGLLFVASTTSPVTTFTALAADGTQLGQMRLGPPPGT